MCDCIGVIEKKLADLTGDPKASMDVGFSVIEGDGKNHMVALCTLSYSYHPLKKDKTPSERVKRGYIRGGFCPFCGKSIKPSQGQGTDEAPSAEAVAGVQNVKV